MTGDRERSDERVGPAGSAGQAGGEHPVDGARRVETTQLKVGGMSCSFCAESIRKGVSRQRGVEEVHVSLAHEEALVRFRPDEASEADIRDTLRALGYTVRDPRKVRSFEERRAAMRRERRNLATASAFAIAVFAAMALMWLGLWTMRVWHVWAALGAASFVYFWTGRHILRMAWGAARRGIANQHVLLTAGALAGYIGGVLGTPWPAAGWWGFEGFPAFDFFGVVIFLTTYHLLSGFVSLFVRTRASESVRRLLELRPNTARVVVREGTDGSAVAGKGTPGVAAAGSAPDATRVRELPIEQVRVGDLVRIRPGERVPVDGEVVEGRSAVDEALVTGEPIPEEKTPGDEVIGGSVNGTGTLLVRVTRTGQDSFLFRIARHVEEAKALKPGIVVLVDRVLRYYVPVVLLIALAAFLFWSLFWGALAGAPLWLRAIYAGVTVLVMGYPCALGMATPLALIRGGGMAAERGVLMRSGEAFQILRDVDIVVLDKTGTITEGEPRVVDVVAFGAFTRQEVFRYAASAEGPSEHPLARAIVECAEEERIAVMPARDFDAVPGGGVEATVEGRRVRVGRPAFLADRGIDTLPADAATERAEADGRTVVVVAVEDRLAGLVAIADAVKRDARWTVGRMRELGLAPVMVTGDAERTARAVAREVGIEEVHARVLPHEKADRVRELQGGTAAGAVAPRRRRVAFVGDGINDAPALMQADVGIAIGAGTDIAIESSDVILVGERLSAVLDAYRIGGESYGKTVQNLWLAFVFNGVGVPLAATGLVHPVWAMGAMAASVTAVLLNSFGGRLLPARERGPERAAEAAEARAVVSPETAAAEVAALDTAPPGAVARVVLEVPDIHCAGCENNIRLLLRGRDGIEAVEADANTKRVRVDFRPARIGLAAIEEAVTSLGYRVRSAHAVDETEWPGRRAGPERDGARRPRTSRGGPAPA